MLSSFQHKSFLITRTNTAVGIFGSFSFAVLTSLGAQLVIPLSFTPVPITLQTFFVLASGIVLGRKFGAISQVIYLFLGASGFLEFAGGSVGLSTLLGATSGYLFGFVLAAYLVGSFADSPQTRKPLELLLSLLISTLLIYVSGILGLMIVLKVDFSKAMILGFFPFIPGDLLKLALLMFFQYPFLPLDENLADHNTRTLTFFAIIVSIVTFLFFVVYLFSNGKLPPEHLPSISILLSLLVSLTIYVSVKR